MDRCSPPACPRCRRCRCRRSPCQGSRCRWDPRSSPDPCNPPSHRRHRPARCCRSRGPVRSRPDRRNTPDPCSRSTRCHRRRSRCCKSLSSCRCRSAGFCRPNRSNQLGRCSHRRSHCRRSRAFHTPPLLGDRPVVHRRKGQAPDQNRHRAALPLSRRPFHWWARHPSRSPLRPAGCPPVRYPVRPQTRRPDFRSHHHAGHPSPRRVF